jgi:cob(I)alamin adenosyltransferase
MQPTMHEPAAKMKLKFPEEPPEQQQVFRKDLPFQTRDRIESRSMSICTKTGDQGTTGLMYNKRFSKTHPRIEACGAIDELNAALGMAKALNSDTILKEQLHAIQKELIDLMGELAVEREDLDRYEKSGFRIISETFHLKLEAGIRELEARQISFRGWATPGASASAGALDVARTVCRRAERRVLELIEKEVITNQHILIYLNRLSDLLCLMARAVESEAERELSK